MSTQEEQPIVPDFAVKLQSDTEPQPPGDPGRSLFAEVRVIRQQLQVFGQALERLVDVVSEVDRKLTQPH